MILNKNNSCIYFILFLGSFLQAQETKRIEKDSTKIEELEEVVITGQINPQSIKKSVFEVKVITQRDIELRAGNNLADLLNQSLNINVVPNTSNGKSGVSLFGLDAQYFKILIDNIPVINEEGFGNNVDLTLINLDDVERIEIVEGSMGVQYGANAVSGVINIITKKSLRENTKISIFLQEETVGSEYELFDKGRHIQSVNISHNISETLFGSISYFRNDFGGYWNGRQGEIYDVNDGLRGHDWLPKTQQNAKLTLKFDNGKKFQAFYKFDFLNERIDRFNSIISPNENSQTNTSNPSAIDEIFTNNRFIHNLNVMGGLGEKLTYDVSLSYQEQTKDFERYTFFIRPETRENVLNTEFLSRSTWFSRGTLNNLFQSKKFNLQTGYEIGSFSGKGSPFASSLINSENASVSNELNNYDFFVSSEIEVSNNWSLKPGVRFSFSNIFSPQYMISISSRIDLKNDYELRTIIGSSNRTPSYDELYTFFVDVNHNFQGNPELDPEQGYSIFTHLKKKFNFKNDAVLNSKLSLTYLNLKDRIEFIIVNVNPLESQSNNIDSYKFAGLFFENSYNQGRFKGSFGFGAQGISKILDSNSVAQDDFLYNIQLNSNITYTIPKWNTSATVYFKHIGTQEQFVQKQNAQGEFTFERGQTDPISFLDASVRTTFSKNKLIATIGVRNLLDIDTVNTSAFDGGTHNDAPSQLPLAYGRSFFLKLNYILKI
jgi:outer membrane receptor for ferrienterochelin and colicins